MSRQECDNGPCSHRNQIGRCGPAALSFAYDLALGSRLARGDGILDSGRHGSDDEDPRTAPAAEPSNDRRAIDGARIERP